MTQLSALVGIALAEGAIVIQLAGLLVMDRSAFARALKLLESRGWSLLNQEMTDEPVSGRLTSMGCEALTRILSYRSQAQ